MTKPLFLSLQFVLRSFYFVTQTWIELLRALVHLAMLPIPVLSLPLRALAALYRQRKLEMQVHGTKIELENTLWDNKELKARLQIATREHKLMETMLKELEEEHDEAIVKIELLLGEVRDLKDEIRRLKEVQGKALQDHRAQPQKANINSFRTASFWRSSDSDKDTRMKLAVHDHNQQNTNNNASLNDLAKGDDALAKQREVALSRSLFSALLSLVVGIIVCEAKDPCVPLVVALFSVVSMSLMSVVRLFVALESKPASDVVALLCFNWFILGTLAYPMLPRVARVLVPLASSLLGL